MRLSKKINTQIICEKQFSWSPYNPGQASISDKTKVWFRRRTFHEPNLIHWIKYMKSSASESIRNACFNLEWLSRSFRLARAGISPLDRLWNAFDSDAELFMSQTKCRNSYDVFCKQFDRNAHFSPSEFSSAGIKIGVWITLAGLNNLGRP